MHDVTARGRPRPRACSREAWADRRAAGTATLDGRRRAPGAATDDAASWGSSRTAWRRRVWRARAVSAVHAARTKGGAALTCLTPNSILAMPGRKTMYGMLALQAFSNYVTRGALAPMIQ